MNYQGYELTTIDKKILRVISQKPLHPSALASVINVPRTTVAYRLEKLKRRGLAQRKTVGKKVVWSPMFPVNKKLSGAKIYSGDDLLLAYAQLLQLPSRSIVYSIQGSRAIPGALAILPTTFIQKAHKVYKRKGIIIKGVSNKSALEYLESLDEELIKSHLGRTTGITMFNDLFATDGELYSTSEFLLLVNPGEKLAVVIYNKGIIKIVLEVCKVFFDSLDNHRRFDLNDYFKNLLLNKNI